MAKEKVSQQTIASSLGISQAIVSGVLNNKPVRASEETRQKILAQAKALNYKKATPQKTAQQPDLIAFIIHSENWDDLLPVTRGIQRFFAGSNTLLVQHEWLSNDLPDDILNNVKGCISVSAQLAENQAAVDKIRAKVPLVFILTHDTNTLCDNVIQSPSPAYRTALRHLHALGHRRFGFFGIRNMAFTQSDRIGSFISALLELDYQLPDSNNLYLPYRHEASDSDTRQRLREYLDRITTSEQRPTAIFFETASYAHMFKEEAANYNLSIPDDISIITHTGKSEKNADLSSITVPYEEIGYTAAKALHDRRLNPNGPVAEYRLPECWHPADSIAKPAHP